MNPTLTVFESCAGAKKLLASGYRRVDTMTVLFSKGQIDGAGEAQVVAATSPERWTSAYLRSFYESEDLAETVGPIVSSLLKDREVTLLESRIRGEVAGVLALFRTPGVAGVYCVGTVPELRRRGIGTGLLAAARRLAQAEGRTMILQTLASEGALQFYLGRGFVAMHSKFVLEKSSNGDRGTVPKVDLGVTIDRNASAGLRPFQSVFGGFEQVGAVRGIFGSRTKRVLADLSVEIAEGRGYMKIDDHRGSIVVNAKYLREGSEVDVYLDVIHELVHIRQHGEGKELWDRKFEYVDRPTEIEAYKVAVKEARRLGMTEEQVARYLRIEWIPEEVFGRFLRNVGVEET